MTERAGLVSRIKRWGVAAVALLIAAGGALVGVRSRRHARRAAAIGRLLQREGAALEMSLDEVREHSAKVRAHLANAEAQRIAAERRANELREQGHVSLADLVDRWNR